MPGFCISNFIRMISHDPIICSTKYLRGTIIYWQKHHWRVLDRKWNRFYKEWDYTITKEV